MQVALTDPGDLLAHIEACAAALDEAKRCMQQFGVAIVRAFDLEVNPAPAPAAAQGDEGGMQAR